MIDKAKLQQMLGGNPKSAEKFLAAFESESRKQLGLLDKVMENEDLPMLTIVAHTIKTQCGYLGLDSLVNLAAEIEEKSQKKGNIDELKMQVIVLRKKLIELIEKELR